MSVAEGMVVDPAMGPRSGARTGIASGVRVMDEKALGSIAAATLRVLERVGIRIDHAPALDLLRRNGALVEDNLVRLPAALVERAVATAPQRVTLHARDPRRNVYLGEGGVHFTNLFGATWVQDPASGELREATLQDLATYTRMADALERVDFCLFSVVPQDVTPALLDVECTAVALENTSKHIQLSLETTDWVDEVVAMARAVAEPGTPPPVSAGGVSNSPLHYSADAAAKFMALARHEVPCFVVVGAMAGATAPVTLAGALTMQNAEALAGVVLNQLANPGAPVIYGTFTGGFDMRATKLNLGGPEMALLVAATQQLANHYGLPLGYGTGGVSDSTEIDFQAGSEKASNLLSAALAGVDVIHDAVGLMGAGMQSNLAQLVIDNEICNAAAFFLQGVPVDEETIAEDVIASVGPGGHFLDTDHTVRHFRRTLYSSPLGQRAASGDAGLVETAAKRAEQILAKHQPLPLSAGQREALASILAGARSRVGGA